MVFFTLCLFFSADIASVRADEPREPVRFEMEEIVVTASGIDEPIRNIPKNVTVITSEDIAQAPGNTVADLLARETGLNLRSFFGNDKQATLDIRGMGAASVSNVLVMVDGFKLNSPDLSGADLSSVPLDQIERIEIVRGASSVLYGDGAVGGVINIITKKGKTTPETRVEIHGGSYDAFDGRFSHRSRVKDLLLSANADYYSSDGYRENGFLHKKDVGLDLGYGLWDSGVTLSLSGAYHSDDYGLPGSVSKPDADSRATRARTDRPDDAGETVDKRVVGGLAFDLGDGRGVLTARRGYRFRDNTYILGFNPLISRADQTNTIDEETRTFTLNFDRGYGFRELEHRFRCGLDHFETFYISERLADKKRKNSAVENFAFFLMNDWSFSQNLTLQLGYRHNTFTGSFREDDRKTFGAENRWVNGVPYDRKWRNQAFETGIVYALNPDTTLFASYATSFRTPNVDELADAEADLHPQEGDHMEIGARRRIGDVLEISATLFRIEIRDEIFYGEVPGTGKPINRNLENRTIRQGVETDIKAYPLDNLYLWGNFTLMSARLKEKNTVIPLVPEIKAALGLEWQVTDPLVLSLTGVLVGPRFDGNDENNNRFEKLGAYEVFDAKLTYTTSKGVAVFAGINNMFDELYSTVAYGETYYPMPERNVYAGVKWVF